MIVVSQFGASLTDDSRGDIYDRNVFIILATAGATTLNVTTVSITTLNVTLQKSIIKLDNYAE
jgi:hypothetical protein